MHIFGKWVGSTTNSNLSSGKFKEGGHEYQLCTGRLLNHSCVFPVFVVLAGCSLHTYISYIHIPYAQLLLVISLNLQLLYSVLSDLVYSCASPPKKWKPFTSRTKLSTVFLGVSPPFSKDKMPMNFQDVPKKLHGHCQPKVAQKFLGHVCFQRIA